MYEGKKDEVSFQHETVIRIATKYGGMDAGEENGIRGYAMTFVVAYIRDFTLGL